MKFELIYTFEDSEQEIIETEVPETFLKTKEKLSEYLTRRLTNNHRDSLLKISCCADARKKDLPDWLLDCNGKLFY